mgnify:CR=1 FL=1
MTFRSGDAALEASSDSGDISVRTGPGSTMFAASPAINAGPRTPVQTA